MPSGSARQESGLGFWGPVLGFCALTAPTTRSAAVALGALFALSASGCGSDERTRILPPVQVGMDSSVAPVFESEDLMIFEVKRAVAFPIIAPDANAMAELSSQSVAPYGRMPWVTLDDVRVQLSWTLSNLDDVPREVELVVDPWNEFGRYWPGVTLVDAEDGEYMPNLSGIDEAFVLDAVSKGELSRRHGVFTYEDMDELARDFATVMNLIANPPTSLPGQQLEEGESALPQYVNHAFYFQNRSDRDPLVRPWVPAVIAGLTGVDVGLRTTKYDTAPKIALEVVVEITDLGNDKVRREGDEDTLLEPTDVIVTIGTQ